MTETRYCPKCGEACSWDDRFCTSCRNELRPTAPRAGAKTPEPLDPLSSMQTELGLPPNAILLNRYQIRKELGAGGMGRVYMAEDQKLGIPVAVKVLRDILRQDPGSVKRLITEAKASIMLAHPNIVRLHNFEDGETTKFLVMEFVEGETLAHKVAREGKLTEEETRRIAIEICKGLEHAHSKKVVHRDMKPGNILLGKDGSVKIADFGIARLCRDSISRLTSQQDSGTLLYMSPEQLDGESRESSDLYSLGVVLYEMLSGDPPFVTGEITAQIRYKAPREIQGASPEMNRIVFKCLEKKPENRFSGIRELREELEGKKHPEPQVTPNQQRFESLRAQGKEAFGAGKYGEAAAIWQEALRLNPVDNSLNEAIAEAQKQAELLRKQYEQGQAEEARKKWVGDILAQANDLWNQGNYQEAERRLQQALQHDPNNAALAEQLARCRERMKEPRLSGPVETGKKGRARWSPLKKIAVFTVAGAVILLAVIIYIAVEWSNSSSYTPYTPPTPIPGGKEAGGGDAGIIVEPPPIQIDVAGRWTYTVTSPDGRTTSGQMQITGRGEQIQLFAEAAYVMPWSDGLIHRFREQSSWVGRLSGTSLAARTTYVTFTMDDIQLPPQGFPWDLDLAVSPDGRSMRGRVTNALGAAGGIAAQRYQ